jgi:ferredoxin-type protein NapF
MKKILRLFNPRAVTALVAVLLLIPVSWKEFTGLSAWLSPFIMLNSILSLKSIVWLNLIAFLILLFVLFRKRWFCLHLCPVGWGCDMVSALNKRKNFTYKRLPDIGKWLAILSLTAAIFGIPLFIIFDPLAIFNGFFTIFSGNLNLAAIISLSGLPLLLLIHLIFPGVWCARLCPLGGIQLIIVDLKIMLNRHFGKSKPESLKNNQGRRYFLMSGIGIISGITIPKFLKPSQERFIRPPAAVEPALFNFLCCRCGSCNKSCPTNIISPHADPGNILSWMTPEVNFKSGYCLETCNLCSQVCPSGAITLFSVRAKSRIFMGTAGIKLDNCLLLNNKECVKCKESCKFSAIEFVPRENIFKVVPVIDTGKCVGCGACEVICPAGCIVINPPLLS